MVLPHHIGHVAGFGVPSDVFSRYMRMAGHDVLMVSGTDEHGTPILVAADEEGVSARELADRNNRLLVEDLVALGLSYDLFTRTTAGNVVTRPVVESQLSADAVELAYSIISSVLPMAPGCSKISFCM